jgi:hypothetical protein
MTQDREERLISDVAELRGMVGRFLLDYDGRKEYIASKADVACVDKKIEDHISNARHKGASWGLWVASVAGFVTAVAALIRVKP